MKIDFKLQHAVVRVIYRLSVAVFRFALAAIVFQVLSIFWQTDQFLEEIATFNKIISKKLSQLGHIQKQHQKAHR